MLRSLIGFLFKHQPLTTDKLRQIENGKAKENSAGNSSMSLFEEIQNDIVSGAPLSTVLRKAKVLAYRLKNQEFKDWIEHELNGYYGENVVVPEYRILSTESRGHFYNLGWRLSDVAIPTFNLPRQLAENINEVNVRQGIKEIESSIETCVNTNSDKLNLPWPPELLPYLNNRVYHNAQCLDAWRVITKGHLVQILDTTRNRLLTFILELADRYPEVAKEDFNNAVREISNEQIQQVFNYYILGGKHNIVGSSDSVSQGGNMAIFDQRGQHVNYQYNAAGNINFDSVQNRVDLVGELEKLKAEVSNAAAAAAIDQEAATDAEYQITKAIQQAQKSEPNKQSIVEYLNGAMSVLKGVSAVAGIVTALAKAAELAQHLF